MSTIFQVGIDFGTSQTKICSRNFSSDNKLVLHQYISNDSIFLPTTITVKPDNTLAYGENENYTFSRFKMASLFNEKLQSNNNDTTTLSPHLCCVLYITNCILEVVCRFGRIPKNIKDVKSFKQNDVDFLFVLGIPTQYERNRNEHLRRSLHYQNLYFAYKLAKEFYTLEEFSKCTLPLLVRKIQNINTSFLSLPISNIEDEYKKHGLFLLAETTAGVFLLRNQFQKTFSSITRNEINRFIANNMGNYMTLDIGAGTTDISFFIFDLIDNQYIRMKYVATRTVDTISTNAVLSYFLQNSSINANQDFEYNQLSNDPQWIHSQKEMKIRLNNILKDHEIGLIDKLLNYYQINFTDHWDFYQGNRGKGCLCYGGGSRLEHITSGFIILNNSSIEIKKYITFGEFSTQFDLRSSSGDPLKYNDTIFKHISKGFDLFPIAIGLSLVDPINKPDNTGNSKTTRVNWLDVSHLIRNNNDCSSLDKLDLFSS